MEKHETGINECYFCKSKEDKLRPVGNYIVKLKDLNTQDGIRRACQSCYINRKIETQKIFETESILKKRLIDRLKSIFF